MPAADQRFFSNRWWIVFGATMSMLVAQAPVTLFTFGLFIKPLGAEFGWDRGQLSAASGVGSIFSGLAIPVIGIMMDRWGVKRILIPFCLRRASVRLPSRRPPFLSSPSSWQQPACSVQDRGR
jgi:MFS family permease